MMLFSGFAAAAFDFGGCFAGMVGWHNVAVIYAVDLAKMSEYVDPNGTCEDNQGKTDDHYFAHPLHGSKDKGENWRFDIRVLEIGGWKLVIGWNLKMFATNARMLNDDY